MEIITSVTTALVYYFCSTAFHYTAGNGFLLLNFYSDGGLKGIDSIPIDIGRTFRGRAAR